MKKGITELATADVNSDERLLVTGLIEDAADKIWDAGSLPDQIEVEAYNDLFRLQIAPPKENRAEVRILRVQTQ